MDKEQDLQFAKELARYKGQWVALKDTHIIASGSNVEEVQRKAEQENVKDYVLHLVPSRRLITAV